MQATSGGSVVDLTALVNNGQWKEAGKEEQDPMQVVFFLGVHGMICLYLSK
jgi:hypothetical protein